jgi:hypothetical protein
MHDEIETEFYDAAVSGADPVTEGFLAMLQRIAGNGIRAIIVESPIVSFVTWPCSSPAMTFAEVQSIEGRGR